MAKHFSVRSNCSFFHTLQSGNYINLFPRTHDFMAKFSWKQRIYQIVDLTKYFSVREIIFHFFTLYTSQWKLFGKKFVKLMVLLKKLLKSWFNEIQFFFLVILNFSFSTLCTCNYEIYHQLNRLTFWKKFLRNWLTRSFISTLFPLFEQNLWNSK